MRALFLNPKAVKLFLNGAWEQAGRPTPLVLADDGGSDTVTLYDAITKKMLGRGSLESSEGFDEGEFYNVNTSYGVQPRDVGYGLILYSALALCAQEHNTNGIRSSDGGAATGLWDSMVRARLAQGSEGDGEHHEEVADVAISVELPTHNSHPRSEYREMVATVRSALDIPDSVADDDIEITLENDVVDVEVRVAWTSNEIGYYLTADSVERSRFLIAVGKTVGVESARGSRQLATVPADLLAAIPVPGKAGANAVVDLFRAIGREDVIVKLRERGDLMQFFQYEGNQMMIPGVPAHFPRPAATPWHQMPLPNVSGLKGLRGLGDGPVGIKLSSTAQDILDRFGDIG